jgi:hypothetical protein
MSSWPGGAASATSDSAPKIPVRLTVRWWSSLLRLELLPVESSPAGLGCLLRVAWVGYNPQLHTGLLLCGVMAVGLGYKPVQRSPFKTVPKCPVDLGCLQCQLLPSICGVAEAQ